jgi:integrase/recombinase XerC
VRRRARREAARLPPFPRAEIEKVLETVAQAATPPHPHDEREHLRILRDRALLYVLADTGLRVSEACGLTRGHLDWTEARARVLGKGNREAIVRFSERSLRYLRAYLDARAELDGQQGRPLSGLPLFARHDKAAGGRVLPLSPRSAEKIVEEWTVAALGERARGTITPPHIPPLFRDRGPAGKRRERPAGPGTGPPPEHHHHPAVHPPERR